MNFDSLIFDLDGTLWDCSAASAEACTRLYHLYGLERTVTADFIKTISGRPAAECDEILFAEVASDSHDEVLDRAAALEISALEKYGPAALYPGVEQGVKVLSRCYKLFLVSNCSSRYLETFISCSAIGDLFTDTECFGRTMLPKAQNIRMIIDRQSLQSPCYIGDTVGDEEAAQGAGIPFFFAKYGFGRPKDPRMAFEDFCSLTEFFMSLVLRHSNQGESATS